MTVQRQATKRYMFLALAMAICATVVSHADEVRYAKELTFQDVLASRPGDPRVYVLSGGGWLRTIRFGDAGRYISKWLQEHPSATVQLVSRMFMTNTRSKRTDQMVYIWIEDGERSPMWIWCVPVFFQVQSWPIWLTT